MPRRTRTDRNARRRPPVTDPHGANEPRPARNKCVELDTIQSRSGNGREDSSVPLSVPVFVLSKSDGSSQDTRPNQQRETGSNWKGSRGVCGEGEEETKWCRRSWKKEEEEEEVVVAGMEGTTTTARERGDERDRQGGDALRHYWP